MNGGRPLRFLAVTLGGWTMVRAALLWPTIDTVPTLIDAMIPRAAAEAFFAKAPPRHSVVRGGAVVSRSIAPQPTEPLSNADSPAEVKTVKSPVPPPVDTIPTQPPPLRPVRLAVAPSRLAGSIWGIARGGRGDILTGSQLGGSQAGVRLTYALGTARRLALAARLSAPLQGRGRELAFGIDWQPRGIPLHVIAEHRIALDGGKGGPAVMVIGGVDPVPIAAGFRLEAYGQAGAIARGRIEPFADGAVRLTWPVAHIGAARIDLGVGSWGGVQRDAARLDIGPSAAVVVPVAARNVRLTLDWRQRIAGDARPGSGPALTIGSDF